mmetsp:Transcript_130943/g.184505  ORF Transcript_130943/g.184505 Transcript_130943/m.184505 type:complete len:211 (+) Transcript_130943:277-909(+)
MCESLDDLDAQLKTLDSRLYYFYGDLEESLAKIFEESKPDAVFVNEDYTPFSVKRDESIAALCKSKDIAFHSCHDLMLNEKTKILQGNKKFFSQYTPFFMKAAKQKIPKPETEAPKNFVNGEELVLKCEYEGNMHEFYVSNPDIEVHGGRKNGLEVLELFKEQKDYSKTRILPIVPTTKISAHVKFGTLSIREVYWKIVDSFGKNHELIR